MLRLIFLLVCTSHFAQVGIGTIDPKSTLDVNGNLSVKTVTLIGSNVATNINDGFYISINPQVQDQEFVLPSPVLFPGRIYFIRNINNTLTAKLSTSAGLIFSKGSTSGGVTQLFMYEFGAVNRRSYWLLSDGQNWTYFD